MSRTLVPCSACHRHAFASEAACPFCGGELGAPRPRRRLDPRLGRAGIVLATSLALGGCSGGKPPVDDPSEEDEQPPPDMVAMYGAPAPEDVDEEIPEEDTVPEGADEAPDDGGGMAPKYGAPPPP